MSLILHVHVVDYIVAQAEGRAGDEVAVVHLKKHLLYPTKSTGTKAVLENYKSNHRLIVTDYLIIIRVVFGRVGCFLFEGESYLLLFAPPTLTPTNRPQTLVVNMNVDISETI